MGVLWGRQDGRCMEEGTSGEIVFMAVMGVILGLIFLAIMVIALD